MRIAIFSPYSIPPHFETELEIAQGHLNRGDEVIFLGCNADLAVCDVNFEHDFRGCMTCISRRRVGLARLTPRAQRRTFPKLSFENRRELGTLRLDFDGLDDLRRYRVDNFDVGYAVLSSLISLTRDPVPDLRPFADFIRGLVRSSVAVFRSIQNYLDVVTTDRMYLFNGRHAPLRAALRACESRGVTFVVHDRGQDLQHYALYENKFPHDLMFADSEIRRAWAASSRDRREAIGAEFFEERRRGTMQSWYSYTQAQKDGLLPEDWNPKARNVVIFSSAEDEFAAIGDEWTPPIYPTQLEGLEEILASLAADTTDLHVYLRLHPNLRGLSNDYTHRLLSLRGERLTLIGPDAPTSSYALIVAAEKVLTFGSTVGVEAVYWGTPSILAGEAFYRRLGATYNAASHDDVMALLRADLTPKDKTPALMYGFYLKTFGIPFQYFTSSDVFEGQFKGERIATSLMTGLALRIFGIVVPLARRVLGRERIGWTDRLIRLFTNRKLASR